ncbi:MAG: hypothetical protein ABH829_03805 [archaeon]
MKKVWRVFTFAGWWLVFLAAALTIIFGVSFIESRFAAVALAVIGFVLAVGGELILTEHHDKKHRFIWEALSLSGIFCLSAGILWVAYIFVVAQAIVGILVLLLIGIILVYLGETQIKGLEKKK